MFLVLVPTYPLEYSVKYKKNVNNECNGWMFFLCAVPLVDFNRCYVPQLNICDVQAQVLMKCFHLERAWRALNPLLTCT